MVAIEKKDDVPQKSSPTESFFAGKSILREKKGILALGLSSSLLLNQKTRLFYIKQDPST